MQQEILDILGDLDDVAGQLRHTFVAKDELVELLVTCAVAQEHLLIVGPPGTAKSELIKRFALLCSPEGGPADDKRVSYFEYLLTRFTEPNEIFGAVNVAAFSQGQGVWRDTRGMLPRAEIAFLDEVFKSNSAILNALLTILNERVFYNGCRREPVPLICAVGATNSVPDDAELAALYDRFLLRVWTDNVEETLFPDLFARGWNLEKQRIAQGYGMSLVNLITTDALRRLHAALEGVDLEPVARPYREAVRRIRAEGIHLSDRRVIKVLKLIAASALRHKRAKANPGDFWVLRHVWNDPEQIPHLQAIVDPYVQEYEGESWSAERSLDAIAEDLGALEGRRDDVQTDADLADFLQQAEGCRRELLRHSSGGPDGVADGARRQALLDRITAQIDALMQRLGEDL
jgi:MoxR-like ATPase